jgi:hypothetical protein
MPCAIPLYPGSLVSAVGVIYPTDPTSAGSAVSRREVNQATLLQERVQQPLDGVQGRGFHPLGGGFVPRSWPSLGGYSAASTRSLETQI